MKSKILISIYVVSLLVIFSGCSKEPGSVIKDFYGAKTWEEKKSFILDSDGLKASDVYYEEAEYSVNEILFEKKIDENTSIYKVTKMRKLSGKEEKQVGQFLITKVGDKEKIDIKTMFAFNKMGLLQFCQSKPSEPKEFWVEVRFEEKYDHNGVTSDLLKLYDGRGIGTIWIFIPSEGLSDDIAKLKELAIKNNEGLALVQISQNPEVYFSDFYILKQEGLKFVKLNPLNDN